MDTHDPMMQGCLEHLRKLPFLLKADLRRGTRGNQRAEATIRLRTEEATWDLEVEVKKTHLTRALVEGIIAQRPAAGQDNWALFALFVGRKLGQYLGQRNVNFVDTVGNCRLALGKRYFAMIEGRTETAVWAAKGRGIGMAGYQVIFALLARNTLLNAPVRTLAEAAGVGKTAAANRVAELIRTGFTEEGRQIRALRRKKELFDRWIGGYETLVRPNFVIGRYQTPDQNPEQLEQRIERVFGEDLTWGLGGGAAAHRLTGYFRGVETILYVRKALPDLAKRLNALPAADGPLTILRGPGPIAFEGKTPRTVHPLLVYTDLLLAPDPRAREAARELREHFLQDIV